MRKANFKCPVQTALFVIGGKWKVLILWNLSDGMKRFGELRTLMPHITQKMLTAQLRELEEDGIIKRKVYPVVPPKVEYSLTPAGETLKPALSMLCKWGTNYQSWSKNRKERMPELAA